MPAARAFAAICHCRVQLPKCRFGGSGPPRSATHLARRHRRFYAGVCRGQDHVNLPNLITVARILSVPVVVWAITSGEMLFAFIVFLAAGISDAVDGFLAKRFGWTTELGAYLDPLADKALIVSIYIALGISEAVPRWLVILVVSRDIMIIGAVMLSWLVDKPVAVKPLLVSKLNTAAQIIFAGLVLGSLGLRFNPGWLLHVMMALVAALTLLSVGAYVREWMRHMGANEEQLK
jgi:cardiolipin synthase